MLIEIDLSSIRQTRWHEFALRFFFGGGITVVAGLVAKKFGSEIGGLFLAFTAIFAAAAALAQKHEIQKKRKMGSNGNDRGIDAAGAEAAGAALGSIGLLAFACVVWAVIDRTRLGLLCPSPSSLGWWSRQELGSSGRGGATSSSNRETTDQILTNGGPLCGQRREL